MSRKLPDSDRTKRTKPISFPRLMALNALGHDTFESRSSAFPPSGSSRTYGWHVYAKAAWAASKTVKKGQYIHNVTGHFLLLGDCQAPFQYSVRCIRDGGVYCLRSVEVYQDSEAAKVGKTKMRTISICMLVLTCMPVTTVPCFWNRGRLVSRQSWLRVALWRTQSSSAVRRLGLG